MLENSQPAEQPANAEAPDVDLAAFVERMAKTSVEQTRLEEANQYQSELRNFVRGHLGPMLDSELKRFADRPPASAHYARDLKTFKAFCDERQLQWRPAAPEFVAWFLLDAADNGASVAKIHRLVSAVSYASRLAEVYDPTSHVLVQSMVRHLSRMIQKKKLQSTTTATESAGNNAQLEGNEQEN